MDIVEAAPEASALGQVADVLGGWQHDDGPLILHPGDLGWYSLRGESATAAAVRTWSRAGRLLAIGLLDGPGLLRLAVDPEAVDDADLGQRIADDVEKDQGGSGEAITAVEARGARSLSAALTARGWGPDELWTPLQRDLTHPVEDPGVRVLQVDVEHAEAWTAVHWSAFRGTPFTGADRDRFVDRWRTMVAGGLHRTARSLMAVDHEGTAVAVTTVWSAGPGRPGLLEPLGVHRDHRGRGYGRAMSLAAAATLQQLGASTARVGTESSNVGAVATYAAAGYVPSSEVADLRRPD